MCIQGRTGSVLHLQAFHVVVFAFTRKETLDVAVAAARITPTGASEARASDEGALQSQEQGFSHAEAVASPQNPSFNARYAKKVKLSTVLDQAEETEVPEITHAWELVGGLPLPEAEPTEDQLASCVSSGGGTPYANFAVLTPHGRRLEAALRARAWLLQVLRTSPLGQLAGVSTRLRS